MDAKKPWQSKTLWANVIMAILAFFPSVQKLVTPEVIALVFGLVNLALRLITKKPIAIE